MKFLMMTLLGCCALLGAIESGVAAPEAAPPSFHFDFKDAGKQEEIADQTGKAQLFFSSPAVVENGALHIDYGAKITVPAANVPDTRGDFTLGAWVVLSNIGAFGIQEYNPIFSKGLHENQVELNLAVQGELPTFAYTDAAGHYEGIIPIGRPYGASTRYANQEWVKSDPEVKPNQWTHLMVVRQKNAIRIFKNGQLIVERLDAPAPIAPTSAPLTIGAERLLGETDNFNTSNMLVNDVRMEGRALNAAEIEAIYDAEKARYPAGYIALNAIRSYYSPEMSDYSYDLETKLKLTEEFEKRLPSDPFAALKTMTGAVKDSRLLINNQAAYPMMVFPNLGYVAPQALMQSSRMVRDFAAADVNLVTVNIGYPAVFWLGEDKYDFSKVDLAFKAMLESNPQAKILSAVYITPPPWFVEKYPEELEQYYYNDSDPKAGTRPYAYSAPLSSQKWRDLSCNAISAFVKHVEAQPYANHVFGYHLLSGDAGEWYWAAAFTGGMPGYSTATRDDFRRWLQAKYQNDSAALRAAWRDKTVDFTNAVVPSPQERKASERWIFRDAATARNVFDFREYMNETTFAILSRSTQAVKDASAWRKIVSTYYGYSMLFAGKGQTLQKGGILNLDKVLALKSLDMMATPVDYVARRGGETGLNINGFIGSARLHDKIIWREEDLRTHFWPRFEFGRTADTHESVGVIARDFGHSLTNKGMGLWFTAQAGNAAYHQNAMMETMQKLSHIATQSLKEDRRSVAEVALIFDEKSLMHLAVQNSGFIDAHTWGAYQNASMMGAPFDVYLLSDLEKIPDYKLYIFVDAFDVDETTRLLIQRKVRRNNAVSVWCYAPGYINDQGFSAPNMKQLTGIGLQENLHEQSGALEIVDGNHPITKYAGPFPSHSFGPGFEVADATARVLGTVAGKPALAVKETKAAASWRSVYSLMPLTKELLMGLCDYAGAHIYSRSFDVMSANQNYLMLHAVSSGKKTFRLPEKRDISDALTGRKVASDATQWEESVPAKETRIYQTRIR
jgi:hypothetical protein